MAVIFSIFSVSANETIGALAFTKRIYAMLAIKKPKLMIRRNANIFFEIIWETKRQMITIHVKSRIKEKTTMLNG